MTAPPRRAPGAATANVRVASRRSRRVRRHDDRGHSRSPARPKPTTTTRKSTTRRSKRIIRPPWRRRAARPGAPSRWCAQGGAARERSSGGYSSVRPQKARLSVIADLELHDVILLLEQLDRALEHVLRGWETRTASPWIWDLELRELVAHQLRDRLAAPGRSPGGASRSGGRCPSRPGSTLPKSNTLFEKPRFAARSIRMSRTALRVNSVSQASTTASFSSVTVLPVFFEVVPRKPPASPDRRRSPSPGGRSGRRRPNLLLSAPRRRPGSGVRESERSPSGACVLTL